MPDVAAFPRDTDVMSTGHLPLIDISPYMNALSSEEERLATSSALDSACRTFGFFYVTGHGIPLEMMEKLLEQGHHFFDLPQDRKEEISIFKSMDRVRGYQRIGENVTYGKRDQQEAIDIYPEPNIPTSDKLMGSQLWPSEEDLPGFKALVLDYTERMKVVGCAFMRAMADSLGHKEVFEELQKDPYWVLRVIGYPPLAHNHGQEQGISCGAHTDYGCLTFLFADPIPGSLQVEAKDGSWIPAEPVPGAFVVNIGDIIDTLTSHQYKSTFHRVLHRGDTCRVSIPFFFEPSQNATIAPLKGLVPEGEEGMIQPFKYFDHLKRMIYNHFVPNDETLPDKPNVNKLTNRG